MLLIGLKSLESKQQRTLRSFWHRKWMPASSRN